MSEFISIDKSSWKRTPYFEYYFNNVRCSYSMTVDLDITGLKSRAELIGYKIYPLLIYALTTIVNRHEEFRTDIDNEGNVGIWESMNPSYTIFNKQTETFSNIWSNFETDITSFIYNYNQDITLYGNCASPSPKPEAPMNLFPISSIPWTTFSSFNLNIFEDGSYLLPIFTFGKSYTDPTTSKLIIPLSAQVHHAVCDGFHLSRFINELQHCLNNLL
ncbi:MAG: type A chloramphenicol O-acetyltransferase [Tannerellaceae bacterium]